MAQKKNKKTKKKRTTKKKRLKIKYGRILIALVVLALLGYLFFTTFQFKIRNIYITGNQYFKDQTIIELAKLENYPSTFAVPIFKIKSDLEKDVLIAKAKVTKKGLFEVHIDVTENRPLFFHKTLNKTVLLDGSTVKEQYQVPVLINYVPDKIYQKLVTKMNLIEPEILERISEIEYKPNEVDKNRFLLSMRDGNYVYLTLGKFQNINSYVDIIRKFSNKKGILYLDSGEYFKVLESN